ncbi:MAG: 4-hydroxy-tetrahydrodipicolinate reductase [Armatimonadetes bacterium]|nr:4-hydroxy-tetrahydrodipicolinate reductase [Armatimonadota bacterium]
MVAAVSREPDMVLVGAAEKGHEVGRDAGEVAAIGTLGIEITEDFQGILRTARPDVLVDFTVAEAAAGNAAMAIENGVRPVVGTTGMPAEIVQRLGDMCRERKLGGLIAPNFAIGAVLMMEFARTAARFLSDVEIIELHHDRKRDAPSGTALKTAEMIRPVIERQGAARLQEGGGVGDPRGMPVGRVRVHSVRLPGLVAHQEVIFGGLGQTLTIRHDSTSRESFMPGVLLAARKVMGLSDLVVGLEKLLDL